MLNLSRRFIASVLALCCFEAAAVTHPARLRGVLAAAGTDGLAAGAKLLEACEVFCATPERCAHAAFLALRSGQRHQQAKRGLRVSTGAVTQEPMLDEHFVNDASNYLEDYMVKLQTTTVSKTSNTTTSTPSQPTTTTTSTATSTTSTTTSTTTTSTTTTTVSTFPHEPLLDEDYVNDANNYLEDYMADSHTTTTMATTTSTTTSTTKTTTTSTTTATTTTTTTTTTISTTTTTTTSTTTTTQSTFPHEPLMDDDYPEDADNDLFRYSTVGVRGRSSTEALWQIIVARPRSFAQGAAVALLMRLAEEDLDALPASL